MKRLLLLLATVAVFATAQAQHIEFKWRGFYLVGTYDHAMNLNKTPYDDQVTFNGFTVSGGFQFRKESGIGMGASFMRDATGAFSQLPIFVELRSHYLRSRITPFTSIYVGYSIPLGSSSGGAESVHIEEGGVTSGANVGVRFAVTRKFGVNAYVGYQELYMTKVNRKVAGRLADTQPLLLHNLKFGVGFNF